MLKAQPTCLIADVFGAATNQTSFLLMTCGRIKQDAGKFAGPGWAHEAGKSEG